MLRCSGTNLEWFDHGGELRVDPMPEVASMEEVGARLIKWERGGKRGKEYSEQ